MIQIFSNSSYSKIMLYALFSCQFMVSTLPYSHWLVDNDAVFVEILESEKHDSEADEEVDEKDKELRTANTKNTKELFVHIGKMENLDFFNASGYLEINTPPPRRTFS